MLDEVLVIAAGLTIQDPRERPTEHQQAADQLHARFADENSDFLALLNLWRYLGEQQEALSGNQFRRTVKREFLHYLRIREWQDLHGQLRGTARRLGMTVGEPAAEPDERGITRRAAGRSALARRPAGRAGRRADQAGPGREYLGTRNTRFVIAPGTPLAKKPPRWVVAAELVETSRLFARTVARIDPETVEKLAEHLVKRQYSEPRWDAKRGSVVATERVTLYGLPLVVGRRVQYGSIDPSSPAELFIRHALVAGRVDDAPPLLGREPARRRAGRRARGAGPAARHPRRRGDGVRALRRAHPGRRRLDPALRPLVEGRPPPAAGPAHLHAGDADERGDRRAGARRGLSRRGPPLAGADPAAVLRVRARGRPRTASPSTSRSPCWTGSRRRPRGSRWPSPSRASARNW